MFYSRRRDVGGVKEREPGGAHVLDGVSDVRFQGHAVAVDERLKKDLVAAARWRFDPRAEVRFHRGDDTRCVLKVHCDAAIQVEVTFFITALSTDAVRYRINSEPCDETINIFVL